jgi:hypothetical protein
MLIENPGITDARLRNEFQNAKAPDNLQWLEPLETYVPPPPDFTRTTTEEVWPEAILTWTKNNSRLYVANGSNKPFVELGSDAERKRLVPEELYGPIFEKNKAVKGRVTVSRLENSITIIKIEKITSQTL